MRVISLLWVVLLWASFAMAALPPQHQNMEDLEVMMDYIKTHPEVAAKVTSIDLKEYTVYYGNGCKAIFGRKKTVKPKGLVGPADPLEFKKRSCSGSASDRD
ncbi:hypothetical protein [Desulfoluna spongiiphila]|uniref:Uncharacterized protein n=1 Tax=Desulfoluna spongiiphila TaxID=419481 RepID=A0A1G5BKU0_9BACT|nr:hypothetical protein [Desulfoluna spongiiphila]SCX90716.1 hypothetical protein SAMN05216233_10267 [Desulfoluna spongiiphila]VVS93784.1 hypothetical protein DBB_33560 [Desulfoluna spongiiphila]